MLLSIFLVAGLSILLSLVISTKLAIIALSLLSYSLALFAYFTLQRFAGPFERSDMVRSRPLFYPSLVVVALISSVTSLILFGLWYLVAVPVPLWFALGFCCAEISIRNYISRSQKGETPVDRDFAIFAINSAQKRDTLISPNRYPFP
jgi:hypothetical protein